MNPVTGNVRFRCRFDELFGADAFRRCTDRSAELQSELRQARNILVYGAGQTGRLIAGALRGAGYGIGGFLDDTPSKQNTEIDRIPVYSPIHALGLHGPDATIVVAMFTPGHSFRTTRGRLNELGFSSVMSLFAITACLPDSLLPFYFLDRPEKVLAARDHYYRLFDSLIDERSREELVRHLLFRLYFDPDVLPEPIGMNFEYFGQLLPEDVSFVDGGAFDGDSVEAFLNAVGDRFSRVLAFEPDTLNFQKLEVFRAALPHSIRTRIELCNAGLWSQSTHLKFAVTGTLGSTLATGEGNEVPVVALDDYLQTSSPLFIKYDVEGAEHDALLGARRLLKRSNATLAVAVYHQPDDLWSLPSLIQTINPDYRFALRSHMDDGTDLMLYALPPCLSRKLASAS